MPIPTAAPNEVFAYYFQYMICVKQGSSCRVFLDQYHYDPIAPVLSDIDTIWMAAEDLRRIFAPYLQVKVQDTVVTFTYKTPELPVVTVFLEGEKIRKEEDIVRVDLEALMPELGKTCQMDGIFKVFSVDDPENTLSPVAEFTQKRFYLNMINGKNLGEQFFTMWDEKADRLIPYRMYIPSSYDPELPMKTIVCFHGGDANADYMFHLTNNEICRYAEKENYILLALTSYRKYTFFGASRIPTGTDSFDSNIENPLELTSEQWEHSLLAEASVMAQIEDAKKRYSMDEKHMYALGNSGGSLGIFHQVQIIGRPFFRAVCCCGGIQAPSVIDYDKVRKTGTEFLIVYGSEDVFDAQRIIRENIPALINNGLNARLHIVGGGAHLTAWTYALKEIFEFFSKHV